MGHDARLLESRSGEFSEILHQIAKKEADEATSGKPCEPGRAVIV